MIYIILQEWQTPIEHEVNVLASYDSLNNAKERLKVLLQDDIKWISEMVDNIPVEEIKITTESLQTIVKYGKYSSKNYIEEQYLYK